jgi:hypothetical protein
VGGSTPPPPLTNEDPQWPHTIKLFQTLDLLRRYAMSKSILSPLTAKSHYKLPLLRPLQRPRISRDLTTNVDPMQPYHPFIVFFFLQPHGYLSPLPCTKIVALDKSKLKHLHPNGWFHCIFRITFIMCTCKHAWWDGVPPAKGGKWQEMNLQGHAQIGTMRFKMHTRAPKSKFIPKPSGKPSRKYCWCGILACWLRML